MRLALDRERAAAAHRFLLVDLPGYGEANMSQSDKDRCNELIKAYIKRSSLRRVFLLIDASTAITDRDELFIRLLAAYSKPFQFVLTKCDALTHEELCKTLEAMYSRLAQYHPCHPLILPISSIGNAGLREVRASILEAVHVVVPRTKTNHVQIADSIGSVIGLNSFT
eukprot:TRINITY_DN29458_c0_g1_i3.p1 TRINITY_DN29458_c0_g1~~TRINITY_DN29458_c0_g1_i3.p1  ORF type:complete len:168 (-),score=18.13 TRINITY_DN29458_c0_g1_i3:17-520(-)